MFKKIVIGASVGAFSFAIAVVIWSIVFSAHNYFSQGNLIIDTLGFLISIPVSLILYMPVLFLITFIFYLTFSYFMFFACRKFSGWFPYFGIIAGLSISLIVWLIITKQSFDLKSIFSVSGDWLATPSPFLNAIFAYFGAISITVYYKKVFS